jgi:hypothetical protein
MISKKKGKSKWKPLYYVSDIAAASLSVITTTGFFALQQTIA